MTIHFRVVTNYVSEELRRLFLSDDENGGILAEAAKDAERLTKKDSPKNGKKTPKPKRWCKMRVCEEGEKAAGSFHPLDPVRRAR